MKIFLKKQEKNQYKYIIFILIIFALILVLYKPVFYTYFFHKAQKANNDEGRVLYARKALRFSNIDDGRKFYSKALISYIKDISKQNPEKAYNILNKEAGTISSDSLFNQSYAYCYIGKGYNLMKQDKNLSLYEYVTAESYFKNSAANDEDFKMLIKDIIYPKLNSNEKIINTVSGDITGSGLNDLLVVTTDGKNDRGIIFRYKSNDFVPVYSFNLKSDSIASLSYKKISKNNNVFIVVNKVADKEQEINVISHDDRTDNYNILYNLKLNGSFLEEDIDMDKYTEIGMKDSTNKNIIWLKYKNSNFEFLKKTDLSGKDVNDNENIFVY